MDWNPTQYLKFADYRTRPSFDLIGRIDLAAPRLVFDLGCGPGSVTRLLAERWPKARIIGVDSSAEMIETAQKLKTAIEWRHADIAQWRPDTPVDLIYSSATLQWLPDHGSLIPRLFGFLAKGGVLAIQMPRNFDAPSHIEMRETAKAGPWRQALKPLIREAPVHQPDVYWDRLAGPGVALDIWETEYLHVLTGDDPVVEWTKGTGLRPFLDALDEPWKSRFFAEYKARIAKAYPARPDGTTLFPFRRIFILAKKV